MQAFINANVLACDNFHPLKSHGVQVKQTLFQIPSSHLVAIYHSLSPLGLFSSPQNGYLTIFGQCVDIHDMLSTPMMVILFLLLLLLFKSDLILDS